MNSYRYRVSFHLYNSSANTGVTEFLIINLSVFLGHPAGLWLYRCNNIIYPIDNLPKASIVISFYNEALSTLLRSVYSIVDRTPYQLIQEIILVDDFSNDRTSCHTHASLHTLSP